MPTLTGTTESTDLQEVVLDGVNNDLLHFPEVHEGHQVCQCRDFHHAVHMAELLQQAQDCHPLQGLAVLLQRHLLNWAGTCKRQASCLPIFAGFW